MFSFLVLGGVLGRATLGGDRGLVKDGHELLTVGLEGGLARGLSLGLLEDGTAFGSEGKGVKLNASTKVGERVLLAVGLADLARALRTKDGLNLAGVDDALKVSVSHHGTRRLEARLLGRSSRLGAEDGVESLESRLSPDDEATKVSTRSKLKEVEAVHVSQIYTRDVAESTGDGVIGGLSVDDEGSKALDVASVARLTSTTTNTARSLDLLDISICLDSLEESDGLLGLGDIQIGIGNDEGDLSDLIDLVTASHDEGSRGSSSQSGAGSVSALTLRDLLVPLAVSLGDTEHATST